MLVLWGWWWNSGSGLYGYGILALTDRSQVRVPQIVYKCIFGGCGARIGYSCCGSGSRVLVGVVA